jgi:hypothetical protein
MSGDAPKWDKGMLDAFVIGKRNRGERYIPRLLGPPLSLHEYLEQEYEKNDFDKSEMPVI